MKSKIVSLTAATLAGLVLLTACSDEGKTGTDNSTTSSASDTAANEPVKLTLSQGKYDNNKVFPRTSVSVSTNKGSDLYVTMQNDTTGAYVDAEQEGNTWRVNEPLGYGASYTINAKSAGVSKSWNLSVLSPITAEPVVSPMDNSEVGVGQTVAVKFDVAIPDRKKAEEAIHVKTEPAVEGKFHWVSDTEVRWRPENYWKPGTKVSVNVDTYGRYMGGEIWGGNNQSTNFTIGDRTVAFVDDKTKRISIWKNNRKVKEFPISLGKAAHETPNGRYIIGDRNESMIMDSSTYGVGIDEAEGYRLDVDYATQMSYSGIYLHSAPWAAGAIGSYNQSHGCINAMPEDAKWFLENTKRGDMVIVKNTSGGVLDGNDGLGDWNIPWDQWGN